MTVSKVAVSLPSELIGEVKRRAASSDESVSGWLRDAAERKMKSEDLGQFLAELDEEFGPVPEDVLARAAALWTD